jgi:multicomponent Na+:H+ antiporter subunit B
MSTEEIDPTKEVNRIYVESTIIMTTVRLVVPFVFAYGLFVMFHGADSAGGGFQGGVIVAASILLVGFAFGIDATRIWISELLTRMAIVTGGTIFVLIGIGSVLNGGAFLDYSAYGLDKTGIKYIIEIIELAIGAIVSGVLIGLFFTLAKGDMRSGEDEQKSAESGQDQEATS